MALQPTSGPTRVLLAVALGIAGTPVGCAEDSADRRTGWTAPQLDADRGCQAGAPAACAQLGALLVESDRDRSDFERGIVLLEVACGQQAMSACATLARLYGRQDDKRARARGRDLATRACAAQTAEACTLVGELARIEDPGDAQAAAQAFRDGCQMGDARGCELYGVTQSNDNVGNDKAAAEEAFGRACAAGRRSACHRLALLRFRKAESRQEGLALLADNCNGGHAASCAIAAFSAAPVVSGNPACSRAVPFAIKACQDKERNACAVLDACRLEAAPGDPSAIERLRMACDAQVALACLYWADREAARTDRTPDPERVQNAYQAACSAGFPAAETGCPRAAAATLARAKDETEAEAPLSTLRQACAHASAEACCALGDAYRDGKGIPADASKASTFRAKACSLGLARCCSR